MTTMETENITLVLEIDKPRDVQWSKNEQNIEVSDRFLIDIEATGLTHTLTIINVTMGENAEIMATINDKNYGYITSSGVVTVNGGLSNRTYKGTFNHTTEISIKI